MNESLFAYLDASPSPFHAVANAANRLVEYGFRELRERDAWGDVSGRCFVLRGGALIAWVASDPDPVTAGFHIIGAHTDSPNLRVKPNASLNNVGYRQVAVEIYGGALANSWLDRDLGVSGRLITTNGSSTLVCVKTPVARVPQLAIHLDREVNEKGLVLDKQQHILPVIGLGTVDGLAFQEWVAAEAGVDANDVASFDLMLHDLTPAAHLGAEQEFIVSGRIDNLFSCWAGIESLIAVAPTAGGSIPMMAMFDHEEVGSSSTTGAAGPLLEIVLHRVGHALGLDVDQRARAMIASTCLSSDMAHAVHPNYADRHDPGHRPLPNHGPVLKVNVNQRYATDAVSAARFRAACARVDVPLQVFVSKNSQPCGTTIGPITATRLGIETVDVGCAMLSMHSARELCGSHDPALYVRALTSYLLG